MERGREVDGDHPVPLFVRKRLDRRHVLHAGVVDQDGEAAELVLRLCQHGGDLVGACHVAGRVGYLDAVTLGHFGAQAFHHGAVAEAVQQDMRTLGRQRAGHAQADPAGGAGDDSHPAMKLSAIGHGTFLRSTHPITRVL